MNTTLLDSKGNPVSVKKSSGWNLDPAFFLPGGNNDTTLDEIAAKPYQYHALINSAARTISSNVSRLPRYLVDVNNPEVPIEEHPILDVFKVPNIYMPSAVVFWQAVILNLLLSCKSLKTGRNGTGGQVFLIQTDIKGNAIDLTKPNTKPTSITPYNDTVIRPVQDKQTGALEGWLFDTTGIGGRSGIKIHYKLNEVIRIHLFNPYDYLSGMSYFRPAQLAFEQDVLSSIYNTTFFQNNATIAGLLTSDEYLSDEQYKQNMLRWYDNFGGVGNSNKTAMLGNGLKYQQYGQSHADMQFREQKEWDKDQMLSAFGLNKIAVGDYEKINYNTIKEGRKILWQDTYQPIDQLINNAITNQWVRYIEPNYVLKSDYSNIEELKADYSQEAAAAQIMVNMGIPVKLAANISGIPLTEENVKEYPWLDERPVNISSTPETTTTESDKRIKSAKTERTEEERIKLSWDYIKTVLDPGEKRFVVKIRRFFESERNLMQDKVDKWLNNQGEDTSIVMLTSSMFLLPTLPEDKKLEKLFKPLARSQMNAEEARLEQELNGLIAFEVTNEDVDEMVLLRRNEIKEINTTTFKKANKKIGEAIAEAIKDNDTPQQAAKKIKAAIADVGEIRKNQSVTIARTETGIISSATRFKAFVKEGVEYWEWLNAADEGVRHNHKNIASGGVGGTIVRVGDTFPIVNLRFPLDSRGMPSEIINCRCVAIAAENPKL